MKNKIFSFDAETDGLWGKAFTIAAVVIEDGIVTKKFVAKIDTVVYHAWVIKNVLPIIAKQKITHSSYEEMLKAFSEFYYENKKDSEIITHMGYVVESKIIRDMYDYGFIGERGGPYPLIDISGNLQQAGFDPTSVDPYAKAHNIHIDGTAHDPLYDSIITGMVYNHLRKL